MNYYDEEERRKLNELLSQGVISSNGMIDGIPNQTLAALMADNSEQGVQFAPQFQQSEMDRNREQFAREDVRAMERGYNPQQYQTPQAPIQPQQPAALQPQNWIQKGNGEKISLDQYAGNRPHDPFRDGPEILGRQRTPDGGEVIYKRVAGMDGFGRQSARVVQEFVPPPNFDAMKKTLEIQKLQKEINQGPIAPAGYRSNPDGSMSFIPGGPADPSMRSVNKPMSTTAQKELIESDESIQGGNAAIDLLSQAQKMNESAMGFKGAGALASMGTVLPDGMRPESVDATLNLDNILQSQALPQLKSIFGGMPTEGERKILLDIQGSSSQPAKVRAEIFKRAEKAIQNRLAFSKDKSQRLRAGTYFSGDGMANQQVASPNASANTVTLPDGRVKTFPSAAAAQAYKQAAGL